jgi:DNA-binding MarR family transcriptional regulator
VKLDHRNGNLHGSILHLLHRAGQQAEIMFTEELTGDRGMTPRQYAVLACVENNEDISQTGLVTETGIDRSTLADVVRRLVERGMLSRKRTRQDARMYAVRITPKGREALHNVRPAAIRADERILNVLPQRTRTEFLQTLLEIVQGLDLIVQAKEAA